MKINIRKDKSSSKKRQRKKSKKQSPKVAYGVGGFFFLLGMAFLFFGWSMFNSYRQFRSTAVTKTGIVVEVKTGRGSAEGLVVRLNDSDKGEPLFLSVGQYGSAYDEGDEIEVVYIEGRPQTAGLALAFGPWISMGIVVLIGSAGVLMGGAAVLQTLRK